MPSWLPYEAETTVNRFVRNNSSKSMQANRISYWLDGNGPSFGIDNGCCGSTAALEMAYNRMKSGEIDCAIVGGCNLCIHPVLNVNLKRAGLLCLDGKTKCFDKNGNGYVRSEAISVYFLQKARDAKRIYSEVYHVKGKYFATPDASFSQKRDPKDIEKFLEEFYSEVDVSPKDVEYIEANGVGIAEADGNELEAIGNVFGENRTIKIGSVKSNMGNTEAASGACSVIKMCLAYQEGKIPANLHFKEPQNHIPAVKEGKLQVVTEHEHFKRNFTAINNFCYTGSNFHMLLKGLYNPKNLDRYKSTIPRLVLVSGRNEDSVNKMLDILESNPVDPEQYALLNNFFKTNVPGFTGRGYTILDSSAIKETVRLSRSFEFYSGNTHPVWFLYSGMGSQWAGMGEGLLDIPVFAAAIERCNKVLLLKGLDVIKILTDKDSRNLDLNNSFVAITAVQIGLTDVLKSLQIIPDNIIGHSVGEIGSAYADGSLTAEEAILVSYSRGIVSHKTQFIKGKMAAVGLGFKQVSKICPPEIQVACHNSSESATISGPAEIVTDFVMRLTEQGVFAKEVATSNIAFHSRYIAEAGPELLVLQKQIIKEPKLRSKKWLSTCFLHEDWHKPESKYASAEYFTHNLLNAVLFEEAAQFIPDDAIIIEIAPHGLLQAIMKRSHSQCMNLSLTRRGEKNSVKLLLETIGKLYQAGLNPDVEALYPKVEFPVSTETPLLSHFVGWEHSEDWPLDKFVIEEPKISTNKEFIISTHDDDYTFLRNHVRNGVNALPESAVLVFVWDTLADYYGVNFSDMSVVFDGIKFYGEIIIKPKEVLKLNITIQKGSCRFEVLNEDTLVADGSIEAVEKTNKKCGKIMFNDNETHLNQNDVYTLLSIRGYAYKGKFQSIQSTNIEKTKGNITWNGNWITFLDAIIQFNILSKHHDGVSLVKFINKLTINVDEHNKFKSTTIPGVQSFNVLVLEDIGDTKCGGVIIKDIVYKEIPKTEIVPQNLKTRKFFAHFPSHDVDLHTALLVNLQVICENVMSNDKINIKEVTNDRRLLTISNELKKLAEELPLQKINIETVDVIHHVDKTNLINADVLIIENELNHYELIQEIINDINENVFIWSIGETTSKPAFKCSMEIITVMNVLNQKIVLMKKSKQLEFNNFSVVTTQKDNVFYTDKLKTNIHEDKTVIVVVEKKPQFSIQSIRHDVMKYKNTHWFIIDQKSPKFSITSNFYKQQIQKGLKKNVIDNDQWGSYAYIPVSTKPNDRRNIQLIAKRLNSTERLTWTDDPVISSKQTVQVCYSGLSTKDCKKLSDNENKYFGMDFSGIDNRGQRVMGLLPQGALASTVEADLDLLWPVPQHWTLAEAATVPLPYIHALYCLEIKSTLHKNSTILVTGAAGALGQAVICIALSQGCTVFATVSNAAKKLFLLKLFPKFDENNIGFNYDGAFRDMVIARTENKRCNIVINCGTGKLREDAMGCVRFDSYFLDVNDTDYKENLKFGMFYLREAKSYRSVNLSSIFAEKYSKHKKILQVMLSEGIAKGFVKPLTSIIFTTTDIDRAFKLLSNRCNRGRALINMKDPAMVKVNFEVTSRLVLSSSKSYIVVCDGTTLGVELIDRLIQNGAKHILVHCNPKLINGYFHAKYASWNKSGVNIAFSSDDLQKESSCQKLVDGGKKLGQIDGIFITVKELGEENDYIKIDQDYVNTALVVSNLDKVTQKCSELRYFAVIAATPSNDSNKYKYEEIEKCCSLRHELGFSSLFLRHIWNDETMLPHSLSAIFNAMESSLKNKYVIVISSDSGDRGTDDSVLAKPSDNTNFNGGLEAFYKGILEDEVKAAEPVVQMKTKLTLNYKHELLIDPEDTFLMMIPGIEGNYEVFTSIAENVKKPAVTLQLAPNLNNSIPEMAKELFNNIKVRFHLKSPFYLLGYSFGANVALELAALFEKEGMVGVVYCLDSSPDAMRIHFDAYLRKLTNEQLQNSLIEHFFKLLAGNESKELKDVLKETTNWSNKIEIFISNVKGYVSHSHQFMINILQEAYNRIQMAKEYEPKLNLDSEIVLLKGIPHPNAEQLSYDYNLSKYTNKPVQVFDIDSDHALALFDCKISNFINRTLLS